MRRTGLSVLKAVVVICLSVGSIGCASDAEFTTEQRKANGLVVILPGIEGRVSGHSEDIRKGLASAGIDRALLIYSWGRPIPGVGMVLNQMDFLGNRLAGIRIARMIAQYQDSHPGKPVHIVGHSGGGGVAVFAAEAMPEGRQIDALLLLSASISEGYDLTKALGHCRNGIVNFYNPEDSLLGVGTIATSTVDGVKSASAGLNGFTKSFPRLRQVQIRASGAPHTAVTRPYYVRSSVASWVYGRDW